MAKAKSTPVRASLQPRADRQDIASVHLLWLMSARVFVKPSSCWLWGGPRSENGYGVIEVRGTIYRVHRVVYEYCVADIPEGLIVLHSCDNPPCCNPEHLRAGTHADNSADCLARGRNPACKLTEDDVRLLRRLAVGPSRLPHRRLAERFGISADTVSQIVRCDTWRHVE